tara:strand:- start:142 stop:318 length:177 start_codon:yes stop_codon:yes gene_type:complete
LAVGSAQAKTRIPDNAAEMGNSTIAINAPRIYQVDDAIFCDSLGDTKIWKNLKNRIFR